MYETCADQFKRCVSCDYVRGQKGEESAGDYGLAWIWPCKVHARQHYIQNASGGASGRRRAADT